MLAVLYFAPLCLLFTAITSCAGGDKIVLWLVLAFAAWGIGVPAACVYYDNHPELWSEVRR